jgi:hypothetical protein
VLRIEEDEKKVGLSMRGVAQPSEEEIAELQASAAPVVDEHRRRDGAQDQEQEQEQDEEEHSEEE